MTIVKKKFHTGLNLKPGSPATNSAQGDIETLSTDGKMYYDNGSVSDPVVTETTTATLTNKTIAAGSNTISGLTNSNLSGTAGITDANLATISTAGKVSNSATTATSANTPSAIVARDGSGNFSAGTITASLSGNATTATTATTSTTATTATNATNVATTQVSNNASYFPLMVSSSTNGNQAADLGTGLTFNPSTNNLATTTFTGALSGNATTATTATNVSGVVAPANGGTGVANNAASTLTISGNFGTTLTVSNTTSVTLPTAGTLSTLAGTETLTNKTFGDAITSTQISTPSTPSAGFSKIYSKSDGFFYQLDPNGTERKIGTGSGGINYVTNPDAEGSTTGWATYANTAANIPSNGTGGSATGLTFSRSTSSPLIGTGSFLMTQANTTSLQGKGVSYDFTIDSAYQAQPLQISMNYNASSTFVASNGTTAPLNDGTTTTNAGNSDIEVFIYDKTNSVLIPVSPEVFTANGSNNFLYTGTFQTASNSTSYRLILHVATTSANATGWNFKFDNVVIGPQNAIQGVAATDWKNDLSWTFSNIGTVTNNNVWYARNGDTMKVRGSVTSGTVVAASFSINLPTGYTIDSTKYSSTASVQGVGIAETPNAGGAGVFTVNTGAKLFYDGSTTSGVFMGAVASGGTFTKANGNTVLGNNTVLSFEFEVPITGWSSTVQMSNAASTRVVAAILSGDPASATSGNPIIVPTVSVDTHGAYNATTGRYTVPVSGLYKIYGALSSASSATTLTIYKNAVSTSLAGNLDSNGKATFASALSCVAGDIIDLRPGGTVDATNMTMNIEMLQGPSQIAVTDAVNMRYFSSSSSVSSSLGTVTYATKDYDSHNAYSSGVWTAPVSGKYQVNVALLITGTVALNNNLVLEIQKNSTVVSRFTEFFAATLTDGKATMGDIINCLAGDTIRIQASSSVTGPSIVSSNFDNYLSLARLGN